LTQRWGGPDAAGRAAEHLLELPSDIGAWRAIEEVPLRDAERAVLECHAHLRRVYRHETTGQTAQLSVLLGPAGPTSVHTPDMCLASRTYRLDGARAILSLEGRRDQFWTVTFRSTDAEHRPLRVAYAWRFDGAWDAPNQPRITFGTRPYLYKMQVVCQGNAEQSRAACEKFLSDVLPVLSEHLK
jgi:hypothetical protein